jgi:hypothetical protein
MSGSIPLSKEHGLNPALTICPICGGDTNEIALVGNGNKYYCQNHPDYKTVCYSTKDFDCPYCRKEQSTNSTQYRHHGSPVFISKFDGSREKLTSIEPCDACKKRLEESSEELKLGGVPWRCKECGSEGVVKHNTEYAINFKAMLKEKGLPERTGVEFESCPVCEL